MLFLILVILLVCLLLYNTIEDIFLLYIDGSPPGPISLPLIGGLYRLDKNYPPISIKGLIKQYGEVMSIRLGFTGVRSVFINNPATVKEVFSNLEVHDRPSLPYFDLLTPHGAGIGTRPYDRIWMLHTKIIKSAFSQISKTSLFEKTGQTLEILFKRWSNNDQREITDDLQLASMSFIINVLHGKSHEDWSAENFLSLLQDNRKAMDGLVPLHPINLCPPLKHAPLGFVKTVKDITKRRDLYNQQLYEEHKLSYNGQVRDLFDIMFDKEKSNTILDLQDPQKQNNLFMSFTALTMAGFDNLRFMMEWCILVLASKPNIAENIYKELEKKVSLDTMVPLEAKPHLPYTEATLREIIRIASVTPLGVPRINRTEIKINGYKVPPNSQIFMNLWHIHTSEKYWEDPQCINPSRFLDASRQLKPADDKIYQNYFPFGCGRRKCIGEDLTQNFLFLFISNVVRKFTLKTDSEMQLIGTFSMCHIPKSMKVSFSPRDM